jgi:Spy/CpxP family protein refolding chaperone
MKSALFLIGLLLSTGAWAQRANPKKNKPAPDNERIEAVRVAFITERLELSPAQSQTFWPVYNAYVAENKTIRQELRALASRGLNLNDDELKRELEKRFDLQEKQLALQRRYHREFLKVITPRQVAELYKGEEQFKALLLRRLGNKNPTEEVEE